jgi:hypothetical protein
MFYGLNSNFSVCFDMNIARVMSDSFLLYVYCFHLRTMNCGLSIVNGLFLRFYSQFMVLCYYCNLAVYSGFLFLI